MVEGKYTWGKGFIVAETRIQNGNRRRRKEGNLNLYELVIQSADQPPELGLLLG